jgi:peptidoglycan-associated lipoprotein
MNLYMLNRKLLTVATALLLASCSSLSKNNEVKTSPETQAQAVKESERVVYFDTDKFNLKSDAKETLDEKVIPWLKANQQLNVTVEGHCDERGSTAYNKVLGKKRAESVKSYLIANDIKAHRIKTISYGFSKPVALGHNEEAWSQNRRAATISYSRN